MSVVIRLSRMGTKKKPHHKIVIMDERKSRDSKFIEEIGYYDPSKKPALVNIKMERAMHWLSQGAKPSATVKSILKQQKIPLKVKKGGG